jgi:hypothetical protein
MKLRIDFLGRVIIFYILFQSCSIQKNRRNEEVTQKDKVNSLIDHFEKIYTDTIFHKTAKLNLLDRKVGILLDTFINEFNHLPERD